MKEITTTPTAFYFAVSMLPKLGADFGVLESALDIVLSFSVFIKSADLFIVFKFSGGLSFFHYSDTLHS
jgi:hypothetical protein